MFTTSSFLNVAISRLSLSFIKLNEESSDFGQFFGQRNNLKMSLWAMGTCDKLFFFVKKKLNRKQLID